ncbi:hypothetical protein OSB04_011639 [Centaurea solstitialis]|uniref:Pentatricopeptide repeat-containing protein n=1 Tax=Centaurea solstitialis TaxID=347529 RepID=A0AA38T9T9_9ASTR|nr:hypothetical protein OSB04_011639 [Centaurea solstitialis]
MDPSKILIGEPSVKKNTRGRPKVKRVHHQTQVPHRYSCSDLNQEPPRHSSSFMDLNEEPSRHSSAFMDLNEEPSRHTSAFMDLNEEPFRHSSFFMDLNEGPFGQCSYQFNSNEIPLEAHNALLKHIPEIFHPYISNTQDVRGDGNCGFRSIVVCVGYDENQWPYVRRELLDELLSSYSTYSRVLYGIDEILTSLSFWESPAPGPYWMTILRQLEGEYLMPPISALWMRNKIPSAAGWQTMYESQGDDDNDSNSLLLLGTSPSALLFSKTHFEFASQRRIVAHLHSNSASNHQPHFGSIFEKITKLDDAFNLFDKMTQRQPLPSIVEFTQLLQVVSKMKHYSHVIGLFKQMVAIAAPGFAIVAYGLRRGIVPNVYTFNTLLNGFILEDRILEAERSFKKLIKGKICVPDVVMYNTMIKGLCKCGINETAIALVKLMDKGVVGNDACKMLKEMEEDERISPNVITFNILVYAFCTEGMVEDATTVMNLMIERGKNPDLVTYNSLIDGYCLRAAHNLFREMQARNQIPDALTYGIILEGLCNNHQIDEALSLFRLMGDSKLNSNIYVYTILMDGACKCGKLEVAGDLFIDPSVKGLQHNVRSCTVMISGFCLEGLIEEAKELFLQMNERGCPPNSVTYNVLLRGLLKNKQLDTIETLLREMNGRVFLLDALTLSLLVAHIRPRSADATFLKLIGKLVPKQGADA